MILRVIAETVNYLKIILFAAEIWCMIAHPIAVMEGVERMSYYMKDYKFFRRNGYDKEKAKLFANWLSHGEVQF